MITWQDPVALALAALLIALALRWRHVLIKRGAAPHCAQCTAHAETPTPPARPTRIDVKQLRIGRGTKGTGLRS